ncbi:MAG: hypothetical protein ACLFR1_03800 [Spirochaetia bacterium]
MSASGWRKIFTKSKDEESFSASITDEDKILLWGISKTVLDFFREKTGKQQPNILIGCDSRPTGPAIAEIFLRYFITRKTFPKYLFITAAPELMASAKLDEQIDGFIYVSASHNPIGHNGLKFGLGNGGVLGGSQSQVLIDRFSQFVESESEVKKAYMDLQAAEETVPKIQEIYQAIDDNKNKSLEHYHQFTDMVFTGTDNTQLLQKRKQEYTAQINKIRPGVIAELNGSARTLTIDNTYLTELGCKVTPVNGVPRQITHRIVPEGASLDLCKEELIKFHDEYPQYVLGYVPDCDGDRGNLVYYDTETNTCKIIEAQQVFALTVLAELSFLAYLSDDNTEKLAVVVNGPTSNRINEIAEAFGCSVFRSEVGEANAVTKARELREQGYIVRILGEGSNGGNITHPAAVRDPLNTVLSIIKLLSIRTTKDKQGLFHIWLTRAGMGSSYDPQYTLTDILRTIPQYTTTSAYEDRAIMKVPEITHKQLKASYENLFPSEWEKNKSELSKLLEAASWKEINYEGTQEKEGSGPGVRTGKEKGGLKIIFLTQKGEHAAYIWMRGSGTEPVFRVLADVKGDNKEAEEFLLDWQKRMIRKAIANVTG